MIDILGRNVELRMPATFLILTFNSMLYYKPKNKIVLFLLKRFKLAKTSIKLSMFLHKILSLGSLLTSALS